MNKCNTLFGQLLSFIRDLNLKGSEGTMGQTNTAKNSAHEMSALRLSDQIVDGTLAFTIQSAHHAKIRLPALPSLQTA